MSLKTSIKTAGKDKVRSATQTENIVPQAEIPARTPCFAKYGMVFLAAGKSSRYGEIQENKLLAQKAGKPMYRYLLDQMQKYSMCRRAVVSGIPEILEYADQQGMLAITNQEPEKGISLSLKKGLEACEKTVENLQGVLFAVCDQPNLKAETIERILKLAIQNPGKIICAGNAAHKGNPVLLDRCFFRELYELTGDVGGRQIIKKYPDQVILCETSEEELRDIDEKGMEW